MNDPGKADRAREAQEKRLDEAIEESFPASDPLPTTGTFAGAPHDRPTNTSPKKTAHKRPRLRPQRSSR